MAIRFGIMGTGGVGGYFGGMLARAGFEVAFVARGPHLEFLRTHGLVIQSVVPGVFSVDHALFTANPKEVGPCDVVLFCVKTPSNHVAIPSIAPMVGPQSVIISLQNGVDNPDLLARAYGEDRVMGGVAYIFSGLESPGNVKQTAGPRRLILGELTGAASQRAAAIVAALQQAEINAELSANIRVDLWMKFVFICAVSGMTALTRATLDEILAYSGTASMVRELMREVCAIARAERIPLAAKSDQACYELAARQEPGSRSSLYHDLAAGRRLEIESLNGFVFRRGRRWSIPTPLNHYIYETLKLADLRAARQTGSDC